MTRTPPTARRLRRETREHHRLLRSVPRAKRCFRLIRAGKLDAAHPLLRDLHRDYPYEVIVRMLAHRFLAKKESLRWSRHATLVGGEALAS